MDVKKMDTKEKEFYCNMYQKIVPEEKAVEQLLQMEVNSENGRKRTRKKIKKLQVAAACIACLCVIAGGTVYASQKGYFERIKGNTILGDSLETDNEKMTEELKEDMQVDETQVVSDGTYTFQLVSYYKEVTMGNILLEIMVTRNDGKTITKKELEDFKGDKLIAVEMYGDEDRLGYGARTSWQYDKSNNLIYSLSGFMDLSEKSKKAENVKRIEITQRIYGDKTDEDGNYYVDIKEIGTMSLVQDPVELNTVEMDVSNNPKASKFVISPLGLQLITTEDDKTRNGVIRIYRKDGTEADSGFTTETEYPLEDDKVLYAMTFGTYFDLETIDYIEIAGIKYKTPKDFKMSENDSEKTEKK